MEQLNAWYGLHFLDIRRYILVTLMIKGVVNIRIISLDVPDSVNVGELVRLTCKYDLQGEGLYSVKWYRGDTEFFRFVPSDQPNGQFFPVPGIKVDLKHSINGTVFIRDVSPSTSGVFRCEVSGEAPSFETASEEKLMTVGEKNGRGSDLRNLHWTCFLLLPVTLCFLKLL